jgi:hypothetical protein
LASTEPPPLIGALPSFDGPVSAIVHAGDSWYVGGSFDHVSSYKSSGLVELGLDGGFTSCLAGFDGRVDAIVRWQDATFVGGVFTHFRGIPVDGLAKLSSTCELDSTFDDPVLGGFRVGGAEPVFANVTALAASADALYVGGDFNFYRGVPVNDIAKLDPFTGALDTTFSPPGGNGFNANSVDVLVLTGSSLLVGGEFSSYRGVADSARSIAKLNVTDGSIDTVFSPPGAPNNGFSCESCAARVYSIAVANNDVYVSGDFESYRGTPARGIAKLDLVTGAMDSSVDLGAFGGLSSRVKKLGIRGSTVFAGGAFQSYRGSPAGCFVALDRSSGALLHDFDACSANPVTSTTFELADDSIYVATGPVPTSVRPELWEPGLVTKYLLSTYEIDSNFGSAIGPATFNGAITALHLDATHLWVGGSFTMYSGYEINSLVKLDDQTLEPDLMFSPPGSPPTHRNGISSGDRRGRVDALLPTCSNLVVAGAFSSYRSDDVGGLVSVDLVTGELRQRVGAGGSAMVTHDGAVYVAGGSVITKYDALTLEADPTFHHSFAEHTFIRVLAQNGDSIYACGPDNIAKLDAATGDADPGFSPPAPDITMKVTGCVVTGDALYVGLEYDPTYSHRGVLMKLDLETGAADPTFSPPVVPDGVDLPREIAGYALAAAEDGLVVEYGHVLDVHAAKLRFDDGQLVGAFNVPFVSGRAYVGVPADDALLLGGWFLAGSDVTNAAVVDAASGAFR